MVLKKAFSAAALGLSLIAAVPAQASTITNTDGTFNWTGMDWSQNGTAFTTGFAPVAGDLFTIDAFAVAVSLVNNGINLVTPGLDNNANGVATGSYEYTLHVQLQESVVGCTGGGASCTFAIAGGTYSIFYDLARNANALAGSNGTGFLDGALLLSGSVFAQPGGSFSTITPGNGIGVVGLLGDVGFTNTLFINPTQTGTTAVTTLQLGSFTTNGWVSPGGFNGVAFSSDPGTQVFQADANQSFSVPEPTSLALFGIAMLAGGAASRRRVKK